MNERVEKSTQFFHILHLLHEVNILCNQIAVIKK